MQPGRARRRTRRGALTPRLVAVVAAIVIPLTACQVNVDVSTKVNEDGSGTVTVAAGFDDKALARLGKPDIAIVVDDMKAAGWEFNPPVRGTDGLTWYRGTKRFATPQEATAIYEQFTGERGPFRDFALDKQSSLGRTTWSYKGTVDLTGGMRSFGEPALAQVLQGDMFGGKVSEVEATEGKPVSQMFTLRMAVDLPGSETREWRPSFADPAPTQLNAESSQISQIPVLPSDGANAFVLVLVALGLAIVFVALVLLRGRFQAIR